MTDKPSDLEIDAYIDGQLDTEGCFAVEDYLRRHPDMAARVMGDLGTRSALRLMARDRRPLPPGLTDMMTGHFVDKPPRWRRWVPLGGLSAAGLAALMLVAVQGRPDYVDDALTSHRIAVMRAGLESQIEMPRFDAKEIRAATNIAVPAVPAGWAITDVQLFPTERGPALLMAVTTTAGERLSIFAQNQKTDAPERPDAVRAGLQSVAYWRRGEMSYALVGESDPGAIDATAEALVRTWS
jgi:anti-sigma factor RsiW